MADLSLEFCGIKFKSPIIIASIETTNSPEVIRECVDAGAAGMIVKTLTDIEDMARLTQNSKYAILNEKNEVKFMLAQSYMPAQDIQILVGDDGKSPWYDLNFGEYLYSAEYTFSKNDLKTF